MAIGEQTVDLGDPVPLEVADLPAPQPRNEPVAIEWTPIRWHDDWHIEAEVYDADRHLMRLATASAAAGKLKIAPCETRQVTHEVCLVLTGPGKLADTPSAGVRRQRTHVRADRRVLGEYYQ